MDVTVNMSGLGSLINGLRHALIGTGRDGDLAKLVQAETRLLAEEIGAPPTANQIKRLERSARKDIGKSFVSGPAISFTGDQARGSNDITWLYAGPKFLYGVGNNLLLRNSDPGLRELHESRKTFHGNKFLDVGKIERTGQHVMLANRFVVNRGVTKKLFELIRSKFGKRDASMMETAAALGSKKVTGASKKHFPTGKNITEQKLIGDSPSIIFGSNAKGIALLSDKVKSAVKKRERMMRGHINRLLNGTVGRIERAAKSKIEARQLKANQDFFDSLP